MDTHGRRGCLILLVVLALFAVIYVYLGKESEETSPSPSQGSLPPPSETTPKGGGKQPMRPLPSDPPG